MLAVHQGRARGMVAGQHLEHIGGQPGGVADLGQFQHRQRGVLGGLGDHHVARGQRHEERVGRHQYGIVVGRDDADHAARVQYDLGVAVANTMPWRTRRGRSSRGAILIT